MLMILKWLPSVVISNLNVKFVREQIQHFEWEFVLGKLCEIIWAETHKL